MANLSLATWQDYWELCKPKVVALMLVTAWVGMLLASPPHIIPWQALVYGTLGIAFCAGAAAAINHLVDRQIDLKMQRTHKRPVATGRVNPFKALGFALILGTLGFVILYWLINPLTAWLTLLSLLGYALIYTLFLKRATPQNIVIGGIAGAAPPLLGWCAVTGTLSPYALLLVLIIFTWTPPHFWALAIYRKEEYANAELPMLPVTHGIHFTKVHILFYLVFMLIITILPYLTGMSGLTYLISAIGLGLGFLYYGIRLYRDSDRKIAIKTFVYSINYLFALFIALLLDHYLHFWFE